MRTDDQMFFGRTIPPADVRQMSKREQHSYLGDIQAQLEQRLSPSFNEAVLAIVGEFIALGYPLQDVVAERDSLLSASFRSGKASFLLAFDVVVSVFFVKKGGNTLVTVKDYSLCSVQLKDGYCLESWQTFVKKAADLTASEVLQTYIELKLVAYLEQPMAKFASHFDVWGCGMRQQQSEGPEIDYRDVDGGFHLGITCIGTVSSATPQ